MIKMGITLERRGDGSKEWDDGGKTNLFGICVFYTDDAIRSVQFFYDVDSNVVVSDSTSGVTSDFKFKRVQLNYPLEYLTSVTGFYNEDSFLSITFVTNKCKYGPYGRTDSDSVQPKPKSFEWDWGPADDVFGGFYGSFDPIYNTLNSIGVYVKPPSLEDE